MADWNTCLNWMLDSEDRARKYAIVPDVGGSAIAGVNSKDWPVQFQKIANLPADQRGPLVALFYQQAFWNQWYSQLTSDEVAKRVFDFSVNAGSVAAVRCLQEAVNWFRSVQPITVDEQLGPATVSAVNACDAIALVKAFQSRRVAHYQQIAAAKPELAHYLPVWTARAEK